MPSAFLLQAICAIYCIGIYENYSSSLCVSKLSCSFEVFQDELFTATELDSLRNIFGTADASGVFSFIPQQWFAYTIRHMSLSIFLFR